MACVPAWRTTAAVTGLVAALFLAVPAEAVSAVNGPTPVVRDGAGDLTPNQLFSSRSLTREEALAACGPAAAVAFARAKGKPVSLDTAVAVARTVGWTAKQGMSGPTGQVALLKSLGVSTTLEAGLDRAKIAREVQAGRPVIIRTAGPTAHYFVAERMDPSSGRYDFAQSALVLRSSGGRRWFSLDEIAGLGMGSPTHAIYMADGGSVTAQASPASGGAAQAMSASGGVTPISTAKGRVVDAGGSGARLRAGPSLEAKIVDLVIDGTALNDLGTTANGSGHTWRRVSLGSGQPAWIDDGLLRPAR